MADAKTKIEDIFVPDRWEQYFIERTAELANFGGSGLVERNEQFDLLAASGARNVEMPFWKDISGGRQLIDDTNAMTTNKIGSSKDNARIHNDGNAWSTTLLSELMSGDDPMSAIEDLVGEYWSRVDEQMLIATVNGILAYLETQSGDPNVLSIASELAGGVNENTILSDLTFLDGIQKLGDVKDRLSAIAVHSLTENDLSKQNQIEFIPGSEGLAMIRVFKGLQVIMDDDMPVRAGTGAETPSGRVMTSVLFGSGAIGRGFAPLNTPLRGGFGTQGVELSRVALNHDDVLINRRRHLLHPRGIAWKEASSGIKDAGPTDAQLALAANWEKVFESKNVRIVGIKHNLGSDIPA